MEFHRKLEKINSLREDIKLSLKKHDIKIKINSCFSKKDEIEIYVENELWEGISFDDIIIDLLTSD